MSIFLLGVNHKTAPLRVREKISFSQQKLSHVLISLNTYPFIEENLILSTCNRVEIYVSSSSSQCFQSITQFLSDFCKAKEDIISTYFYTYKDREAIKHLFRVASSLDSMVIGENQILAQVKNAYLEARTCETVGKTFSLIFEEAIRTGKKVRAQTDISRGAVSISTVAIELAKKVMKRLEKKKVLIIGAGKIGELTVKNLASRGVETICVANRTYRKALELAETFGGEAIRFSSLEWALKNVDIVISSTSAPHIILKRDTVDRVMQSRKTPLFFIDLGVPRNIEESIGQINNVYLYNIDDLIEVKDKNLVKRLIEVKKAEKIVNQAVDHSLKKLTLVTCPANR